MDEFSKIKNIFLNKLKNQIWCDLVIGRSDNNKIQWSDEIIKKYINNIENLLCKCVEDIIKKEYLDDVPDDVIREYLYEFCDTYYGIENEEDEFDEYKHDWSRHSPYNK